MIEYKGYTIFVSEGIFTQGEYGKYSHRGEILHLNIGHDYGNSKDEVVDALKKYIDNELS